MKKLLERTIKKTKTYEMYLEQKGKMGWTEPNNSGEWGLLELDGRYEVALPHSCDQWSIAYGEKDECIKDLEIFINETKEILKELKKIK